MADEEPRFGGDNEVEPAVVDHAAEESEVNKQFQEQNHTFDDKTVKSTLQKQLSFGNAAPASTAPQAQKPPSVNEPHEPMSLTITGYALQKCLDPEGDKFAMHIFHGPRRLLCMP